MPSEPPGKPPTIIPIQFLSLASQMSCQIYKLPHVFSCAILCDPVDCNPPGSSVHGILQARILEWVAMPFSRGSSQPRDRTWVSSCIVGRFFTISATRKQRGLETPLQVTDLNVETNAWCQLALDLDGLSWVRLCPNRLYSPWDSPGQNTGVGCHALLQGIFPTRDQIQVSHIASGFFTV